MKLEELPKFWREVAERQESRVDDTVKGMMHRASAKALRDCAADLERAQMLLPTAPGGKA